MTEEIFAWLEVGDMYAVLVAFHADDVMFNSPNACSLRTTYRTRSRELSLNYETCIHIVHRMTHIAPYQTIIKSEMVRQPPPAKDNVLRFELPEIFHEVSGIGITQLRQEPHGMHPLILISSAHFSLTITVEAYRLLATIQLNMLPCARIIDDVTGSDSGCNRPPTVPGEILNSAIFELRHALT